MKSFKLVNLQGEILGYTRDFYLDSNRQLNLVISKAETPDNNHLFSLNGKYIQTVDTENKLLLVRLSSEEFNNLSEYQSSKDKVTAISEPSSVAAALTTSQEQQNHRKTQNSNTQSGAVYNLSELDNQSSRESEKTTEIAEEEVIRLLEERLVVNRSKQKIGEVVVRKEIETRMIEVPVRREKLIVEQIEIGSEAKQLAEIDLGEGEVTGVEHHKVASVDPRPTLAGEFISPKAASEILQAIALQKPHGCVKVRLEIVVENQRFLETYQELFNRFSKSYS
ncbi:DUF2382 domain-containing protein [Lyngbya aestuarii]|uniref:DUF2382 domain-containing protein n=1 Tax=Lyngbya aestuarii TaxID=118322 RepID=UPI00403D7D0C